MLHFTRIMYFHEGPSRLRSFLQDPRQAARLLKAVRQAAPFARLSTSTAHVFAADWLLESPHLREMAAGQDGSGPNHEEIPGGFILAIDGRYAVKLDEDRLAAVLERASADMIGITVCPELQAGKEAVCLTCDDRIAGFRRLYEDAIDPSPLTAPPHILIVKESCRPNLEQAIAWARDVDHLKQMARDHGFKTLYLRAGGRVLDLECEQGLGAFLSMYSGGDLPADAPAASESGAGADSSRMPSRLMHLRMFNQQDSAFRLRHSFSYARLGKRLFDILVSSCILLVLLPLLVVVAMLVKITSPGPIFYGARRQGLHGKAFDCLKFRTMIVRADAFQDRLRAINQVDGPQFKIVNDPRISGIGKFLRDTCIDELPQFFNVLAGQMSVVGPRPSPAAENECCPSWHDARLSVRPGITGLWQVCRTRRASMDFQEWVYYDTKYVKNLSFSTDLIICFKTAQKLIGNFLDQFG